MRFAILGDHPNGFDFIEALIASGHHELILYRGSTSGYDQILQMGIQPQRVHDLEELLADPLLEAVIVADVLAERGPLVRRVLQSEHHVLCVHPIAPIADIAFETASIQSDVGVVLLPLLDEGQHPALGRFAKLAQQAQEPDPDAPSSARWILEVVRRSQHEILHHWRDKTPGLPGWDVLRRLLGDLAEVFVQVTTEELPPGEPMLITGRFQNGTLLQARYLPNQDECSDQISLVGPGTTIHLEFAKGWTGPAELTFIDAQGNKRTETWQPFNPWPSLVEDFERTVIESKARHPRLHEEDAPEPRLSWQDEIRCLELDVAVRRSAHFRRSISLEYLDASEEANFKSTMTLVGCSLLWITLVLLIFSIWFPKLGWAILPLIAVFLALQVLRWIIPKPTSA